MNKSHFKWALLAGYMVIFGWHQAKIRELEEALKRERITIEKAQMTDTEAEAPGRSAIDKPLGRGRLIALESRIARLEGSRTYRPSAGMERLGDSGNGEAEDDETSSALVAEIDNALDTVLSNPRASEQLRDMIREEQTAVWEERREERRERRANRMQEEVEALSEMLELGGSDADTLNDMMTAENDAIRGFWGQVRSGEISWNRPVRQRACVAMKRIRRCGVLG